MIYRKASRFSRKASTTVKFTTLLQKQLSELAPTPANKNLNVRTEVGAANEEGLELLRVAEHDDVDMIVIATHGMTGRRRIAFGSVARKVVEQADHSCKSQAHSSSSSVTARG
jgi:nucleotide-binding universal stress UspA family protein